jgi:hypothetical protein
VSSDVAGELGSFRCPVPSLPSFSVFLLPSLLPFVLSSLPVSGRIAKDCGLGEEEGSHLCLWFVFELLYNSAKVQ